MEGLQGWMAEIERKQERMTRTGGIAAVLAVAAAGGALALGVLNQQNSASKDDVDDLTTQVEGLQAEVKKTTEQQLKSLNETIGSMDQRIEGLSKQQAQSAADIAELQSQKTVKAAPAVPALPGARP